MSGVWVVHQILVDTQAYFRQQFYQTVLVFLATKFKTIFVHIICLSRIHVWYQLVKGRVQWLRFFRIVGYGHSIWTDKRFYKYHYFGDPIINTSNKYSKFLLVYFYYIHYKLWEGVKCIILQQYHFKMLIDGKNVEMKKLHNEFISQLLFQILTVDFSFIYYLKYIFLM